MTDKLCTEGTATKCDYKRNAKPYTACGYGDVCISQEVITVELHGQKLIDRLKDVK